MLKSLTLMDYPKRDIDIARRKCEQILIDAPLKLPILHPECLITILVPVYDESVSRIKEQLATFSRQNFAKKHFEMVFIVNNSKGNSKLTEILKKNTLVIKWLRKKHHTIPVHVIDRSTKGHELKIGNVGEARNYGIHIIAKRYLDQQRDGIIIQVDADTTPPNVNYLKSVWKDFDKEKAYGAAGGVKFVLSLDNQNTKERAFFKKHLSVVRDYMHWNFFLSALQAEPKSLAIRVQQDTFSGAHMISRAIASVCAGGIRSVSSAEDVFFGRALSAYAKKNQATILHRRDEWIVKTSLRESARTGSSFGPVFENIRKHGRHPLVRSPNTPHYLIFLRDKLKNLQKSKPDTNRNAKRFLNYDIDLTKEEYTSLYSFWAKIHKTKSEKQQMKIYEETRQSHRDAIVHKFFNRLFRHEYPQIPLTSKALNELKTKVNKNPIRKKYVENVIKYYATYHLK